MPPSQPTDAPADATGLKAIPRGIWALGLVSLFMDASSELIHSLLPVFLVSVMGASALSLGLIEGVAEATASITRIFSGTLSDYLGKRKLLTVIGYGLAALTKPIFPLAGTVGWVFAARFLDRVGKGIRGAPRDALIGDLAPPHLRGACFGLRQSLDTVGAVAGPLLAVLFMALLAADIRSVLWVAVVPGVIAVAILVFGVREPDAPRAEHRVRTPIHISELRRLGVACWWLVAVGAVLSFARFSEAFLVLRAQSVGLSLTLVPLVLVVMSAAYSLSAYPAGVLSDRMDRRTVVAVGLLMLIAADLALALATGVWLVAVGVVLWGVHMGLTQGLLAAMIIDATPARLRGTAFGVFHMVSGIALLAASALAGLLWDRYGPPATFYAGMVLAALTLAGLLAMRTPAAGDVRPDEPPK